MAASADAPDLADSQRKLRGCQFNPSDDEAIVQLAREAQVGYLVTHNVRDVSRAARFGIRVVRPAQFLEILRQSK
jgi:hypothetical protein